MTKSDDAPSVRPSDSDGGEWRRLIDGLPQIVWRADPAGVVEALNQRFHDFTGLPPGTGEWRQALHPDDLEGLDRAWARAIEAGGKFEHEFRLRARSGAYRWFLARGLPERGAAGEVLRWVGATTDVHETRETRLMLGNLFSLPGLLLGATSADGRVSRVNPAWEDVLGYAERELLGHRWVDFVVEEDRAKLAPEDGTLNVDVRFRRKDGGFRWLHFTSVPRDGVHYCVARDVTASRVNEMRLASVFSSRATGVIFWRSDGRVTGANDTFLELIGYTRDDLDQGRINWRAMTPPAHDAADTSALAQVAAHGRCAPYEKEYVHRDGTLIPILLSVASLDRAGTGEGVAVVIDLRKQRHSEHRFESIVEDSPFPMVTVGADGRITRVNRAYRTLWNVDGPELEGAFFADPQFEANGVLEHFRRAWSGRTSRVPAFLYDPSASGRLGRPRWVELHLAPLTDANGVVTEVVGKFNDVTDRVVAEQERTRLEVRERAAIEASKLKSGFLANMSHEIRTPINGVIGMTNLLADTPLNSEQREYLESARSSAESLLTVINDILDFSKIESGKLEFDHFDFDLVELFEDVERAFSYAAREKGLRLACKIDPELTRFVRGDQGRVRQVLNNLLSNAIKFTPRGSVAVRVSPRAGGKVRVEVEDTGVGIPAEALGRMFKAFSQADSSTARRFGGTGLGLSISKHLVERMNGTIGVTSRPGEGSTFWFEVVLEVGRAPSRAPSRLMLNVAEIIGRRASILLVEDNAINQKIATKLLEKMGLRCHAVGSGREALEAIREFEYDLILMDCQMPEMDGYEATRIIKTDPSFAGYRRLPIIAMTANALKGDRERCLDAGMDDYLAKPVDLGALTKLLLEYLAPEAGAPPVDAKALDVVRELDGAGDIVALYLETAPEQNRRLARAFETSAFDELRREAHSLKSASANLGLVAVALACAELERVSGLDQGGAAQLVARVQKELARAYPELRRLTQDLG